MPPNKVGNRIAFHADRAPQFHGWQVALGDQSIGKLARYVEPFGDFENGQQAILRRDSNIVVRLFPIRRQIKGISLHTGLAFLCWVLLSF
jgi:hypothetical protein